MIGYGRAGCRIAKALEARDIPYVVAEQNRELVENLRNNGILAVSGSAPPDPAVLIQAHIANAAMLFVATPDPLNVRQIVDTARALNPNIEIVLRTHSEDESRLLRKNQIGTVFFGEEKARQGYDEPYPGTFRPAARGHCTQPRMMAQGRDGARLIGLRAVRELRAHRKAAS